MAEVKTNAMRILEKNKIPYKMHTYDNDGNIDGVSVAKKLGQDVEAVYKTLVTVGKSGGYYVFVIPVEKELSLKKAAKAAGEKSVEMIHVKDINKVTGYIRGGCSPVGMKKLYPTFISDTASERETIIVSGGKIGFQVELSPKDLIGSVKAKFADIIMD